MAAIERLDEWLILLINRPAGSNEVLDQFVRDLADSMILKGGVFLATYSWMWFREDEERDDLRRTIVASLIAALITVAIARFMQLGLPFHPRPLQAPPFGLNVPLGVDPHALSSWSSMPSDHAVLFFALCVPIWSWSRPLAVAALCWTAVVICLPRIYLGFHYPSDVIVGAIVGVVLMVVVRAAVLRTSLPGRIVRWGAVHPGLFCAGALLFGLELANLFGDTRHFGLGAVKFIRQLVA